MIMLQDDDMVVEVEGKKIDFNDLTKAESLIVKGYRNLLLKTGLVLPVARTFKYQNPNATELTTSPMLQRAAVKDHERDSRRNARNC